MSTKVEDIMVRNVRTAGPEETILDTAEKMNRFNIGCIVIADNGTPIGVVTERDILRKVVSGKKDPSRTKLHEIMSKPLITVKPSTAISTAARMMIKHNIKKLPVTDRNRLVGILSLTDLMPLLKKQKTVNRISLDDAPARIKKVFDACIDPETQLRKRCPLMIMGDMALICMGSKCMWYSEDGCAFQSLTRMLLANQTGNRH